MIAAMLPAANAILPLSLCVKYLTIEKTSMQIRTRIATILRIPSLANGHPLPHLQDVHEFAGVTGVFIGVGVADGAADILK